MAITGAALSVHGWAGVLTEEDLRDTGLLDAALTAQDAVDSHTAREAAALRAGEAGFTVAGTANQAE